MMSGSHLNINEVSKLESEQEEPEVSQVVQIASQRIYNENLPFISSNDYLSDTSTGRDVHRTDIEGNDKTSDEFNTMASKDTCPNGMKNGDALLSNDHVKITNSKQDKTIKPASKSEPYSSNPPIKSAISAVNLNEGEEIASKLQNLRLTRKGLSKSVAVHLNEEHVHTKTFLAQQDALHGNVSQSNSAIQAAPDVTVRVDSKNGFPEELQVMTNNVDKRKKSGMQIDKINEKIVKGWNQMISDLTPRSHLDGGTWEGKGEKKNNAPTKKDKDNVEKETLDSLDNSSTQQSMADDVQVHYGDSVVTRNTRSDRPNSIQHPMTKKEVVLRSKSEDCSESLTDHELNRKEIKTNNVKGQQKHDPMLSMD